MITGLRKRHSSVLAKCYQTVARYYWRSARIARREGHWDQSVVYDEQALALDPRNRELLGDTSWNYTMLRQFPAALRVEDRVMEITPNNPSVIASKASIYQAQGNLQEAARLLAAINEQTPSEHALEVKITQLRLERNYGEAVRLLQAKLAQFHYDCQECKSFDQVGLALIQRLAGDTAGAKVTAEQARNTLEQLCRDQPDDANLAGMLSQANAALGEKDSALKEAERAIMLLPSAKNAVDGPAMEENLAVIQTMFGENTSAISTLTRLLRMPGTGWFRDTPVTPALLEARSDLGPVAQRSRFPKTLRGKAAVNPRAK